MRKFIATLVAVLMLSMAIPAVQANEQAVQDYAGAFGVGIPGVGSTAIVFCQGPPEEEICQDAGAPAVGGGRLTVTNAYTNVVVDIDDTGFWGANGATSTCFYNPGGDNICDDDDYGSDAGCGGVALLGSPFANNRVTFWVYTMVIQDDLAVCGGTTGQVSGDFF